MQFLDHASITIKSGDGGNGCAAFHREKYVSRGGPSGGDGGRGGDIIFLADNRVSTLIDYKYKRQYKADRGEDGKPELMSGKDAEPLILRVPVGTVVKDAQTGQVIADMHEEGKQKTVLRGGRGGKGNARFATPTRQAPRFAQNGQKTLPREIELELKTIADIGLIGMPNAGKSTLLSVLTKARPKVADYPFTTLSPNLGVAYIHDSSMVLADIPGLIEGASDGLGLGHDFLRHIERTRLLVHVVDISSTDGRNPIDDYHTINAELKNYSEKLASLPQIVAANKIDVADEGALDEFTAALNDALIIPISAATHKNTRELLSAMFTSLKSLPPPQLFDENEIEFVPAYTPGFSVNKLSEDVFLVEGGDVDKILDTTDPYDEVSMRRFQKLLIDKGIIKALKDNGAVESSTVIMGELEFDFIE